jgi:predicted ATP-grasp superfamily ATP-dependent carboligase
MALFRAGAAPMGSPGTAPALVGPAIKSLARASTPRELDVLLLDAELRQTLAAMRAYARAGLAVGAVACESDAWWAPSLRSRWCSMRATVPDFSIDATAYVDALLDLLDAHPARMVMPAHDGSIQAIRLRRAEIERRTALPLASESALEIAVSKTRTLAVATQLGIAIPRGVPLNDISDIACATKQVGFPAVIKPYESWVERDGVGVRLSPNVVQTSDEAKWTLEHVLSEGGRALLQQWLPGRREAVSLFYTGGRFWARLAQLSYREWPALGGASVLCETIPLLPDITTASERLVSAIDLQGCSMVEFRRDQEGRPVLMEVNPRMGGSVALAIAAGVNFPKLMYEWKLDFPLEETATYRVGKRLRWLAGDVWNIKCVFEHQGQPDIPPRLGATANFLLDFIRPENTLDGLELGDMRPALAEMNKIVFRHSLGRMRKFPPVKWLNSLGKVD